MSQYVSGTAAFTAANFFIDGDEHCESHMLLPGCFDDFDFESPVAILVNHDWNERIGTVGDNAKLWLDGSKLRFSCLLKNTAAAERFRDDHQHARVLGCSIRCSGFSETRHGRNGLPYKAINKVFSIQDVGPVSTARNPFCTGMVVSDRPHAPQRQVARQTISVTSSARGRKPKLMNVAPMPASMLNGMALMKAANRGEGITLGNRTLTAGMVAAMVSGDRAHAIV